MHPPMSFQLETARLRMRPWDEADVDDYRSLVVERDQRALSLHRGDLMPTVENIRARIATQLAETGQTGLALLPIFRTQGRRGDLWPLSAPRCLEHR